MKNIAFNPKELSAAYALKIFYDYLLEEPIGHNLFFTDLILYDSRAKEWLNSVPKVDINSSIDCVVGTFSDRGSSGFGNNSLTIDVSILKNCAYPLTKEEKMNLRKKYNVNTKKPIVVIGFSSGNIDEEKVIQELYKYATIYVVGNASSTDYDLSEEVLQKIHIIKEYGTLKDYYAIADVAINGSNLSLIKDFISNFIEATEGGPLFIVPPTHTKQYGYNKLVQSSVIRECKDVSGLIKQAKQYLKKFKGNSEHKQKRNSHLQHSRSMYLPLLKSFLLEMLDGNPLSMEKPVTNIYVEKNKTEILLMHNQTDWAREYQIDFSKI